MMYLPRQGVSFCRLETPLEVAQVRSVFPFRTVHIPGSRQAAHVPFCQYRDRGDGGEERNVVAPFADLDFAFQVVREEVCFSVFRLDFVPALGRVDFLYHEWHLCIVLGF